ncbi:ribulose bisphosphate carboxylase small subunit [Pseudonocardia sp. N23]|uniref:ribulose bisphosphate carboxylase small subunit n=1 Tax=Pseudonocardia sp. N23 TaxID=1987376 RepID=UPI000BFC35D5|nr:ribulose bisphosphate carboxylase small subunit [Pseudonocardia sp. N23]GAY10007.1 ribulose bisphosphate carboxylase small chain [Pseudonocardia sp. N23]
MRIAQGAFSCLPDLTGAEIALQIDYCRRNGWPVSVEFTDDPHPRDTYWEVWGPKMVDVEDGSS